MQGKYILTSNLQVVEEGSIPSDDALGDFSVENCRYKSFSSLSSIFYI